MSTVQSTDSVLETSADAPVIPPTDAVATGTADDGKGKRKGGKRNKPTKPVYPVPEGKLDTHETPGFLIESHAMLKPSDFNDPLNHSKWKLWYYQEKVKAAEKDVLTMESLGNTPEERKANQEMARMLKAVQNMAAKVKGGGNKQAMAALLESLGTTFADLRNG